MTIEGDLAQAEADIIAGDALIQSNLDAANAALQSDLAEVVSTTQRIQGVINKNAFFADYDGPGLPPEWGNFVGGANGIRADGLVSENAFRLAGPAATQAGISHTTPDGTLPPGWYVLTARTKLISGTYDGAALELWARDAANATVQTKWLNLSTDPDQSGTSGNNTIGDYRTFTKLVEITAGTSTKATLILSSHRNGAAGGIAVANDIEWHEGSLIPASKLDIDAGRIPAAESNIATLQATDVTHSSDIAGNLASINTNATDISALDSRLLIAEGDIGAAESDIITLQATDVTHTNDIASNSSSISANALSITSLDSRLTTAEGDITAAESNITTLQTTSAQHTTDIDGNTTNITANATDITKLTSTVQAVRGAINPNSFFADYDGPGIPPDWGNFVGGANGVHADGLVSGNAFRLAGPAATQAGIAYTSAAGTLPPGWYVLTARTKLVSGTYDGAALELWARDAANATVQTKLLNLSTDPDQSNSSGNNTIGDYRTFTKLVEITAATSTKATLILSSHRNGAAGGIAVANDIEWHEGSLIAARQADIDAGRVVDLEADVTTLSTTSADVEGYLAAQNMLRVGAGGALAAITTRAVSTGIVSESAIKLDADTLIYAADGEVIWSFRRQSGMTFNKGHFAIVGWRHARQIPIL